MEIYAPYIEKTAVTFEYTVPTVDEFSKRIASVTKKYPWIVYEENGVILGYAYAMEEYSRAAFQWTVESSVYVSENAVGKGIGTLLYKTLLSILKKQNFCICTALITYGNKASVKMHEKLGFEYIAERKNIGFKFEEWQSLIIMEKKLNDFSVPPKPVIPIGDLNYEF